MIKYLLDTNILLRIADTSSSQHHLVINTIKEILKSGDKCVITAQVLVEFWVVATRPTDVNGLGWIPQETRDKINQFIAQFILIQETPDIFTNWLQLVTDNDIKGKRTHDIRLLAVMKAHNITHLLTFNPRDFIQLPDLTIIQPQDILTSSNNGQP
jgi:predicted nucleic acid-binding protein